MAPLYIENNISTAQPGSPVQQSQSPISSNAVEHLSEKLQSVALTDDTTTDKPYPDPVYVCPQQQCVHFIPIPPNGSIPMQNNLVTYVSHQQSSLPQSIPSHHGMTQMEGHIPNIITQIPCHSPQQQQQIEMKGSSPLLHTESNELAEVHGKLEDSRLSYTTTHTVPQLIVPATYIAPSPYMTPAVQMHPNHFGTYYIPQTYQTPSGDLTNYALIQAPEQAPLQTLTQPIMPPIYVNTSISPDFYSNPHTTDEPMKRSYTDSPHSVASSSGVSSGSALSDKVEERNDASISQRLQQIWNAEFIEKFSSFPHSWEISPSLMVPPVVSKNKKVPPMKTFMDSAKVRFICPNCSHCWTSMKGRVMFGFDLDFVNKAGLVVFKLFGQKCEKCTSLEWVHAMWYEEEIKKVMYNVYQKVGHTYYRFKRPVVRTDRRTGKPSKPHNPSSCQACEEGICKEERNYV